MYTENFNLNKLPFENVPDPEFFFDHGDYRKIRNRIKDSLLAGRGLIIITGPIGSGKTTLSQMIKSNYCDRFLLIWMAEPPDNSTDLFLFILQELGIETPHTERVFILRDIRNALLKMKSAGNKCLVVIDESHLATKDLLDGIRILNNLEEGPTKLIQTLLLGQVELLETLKKPAMQPFMQRISFLEIIGKMDAAKIRLYISHRIKVAGALPSIFTETGWEAVVIASVTGGGVPRVINSLCDRSLYLAFERGKTAVDIDDVSTIAEEMGIFKELFHYKIEIENKKISSEGFVEEKKLIASSSAQTPTTAAKQPSQKITDTASPKDILVNGKKPVAPRSAQTPTTAAKQPSQKITDTASPKDILVNGKKPVAPRSAQTPTTAAKQPSQEITDTASPYDIPVNGKKLRTLFSSQKTSPVDLKAPLRFLLFSLLILISSIIFYFQRL
jgi:general secretion pathway protein A